MEEIIIGKEIHAMLKEQGGSVGWFACRLGCSRDNVYKIFQRKYIDTDLLMRISIALDYDFFAEYSNLFCENKKAKSDDPEGEI